MSGPDVPLLVYELLGWLMSSFGLFSIVYALLPRNTFTRRRYGVLDLDATACGIARAAGLAYAAVFLFELMRPYFQGSAVAQPHHRQLFGLYWYVFWLEPLRWVLGTQVLWSEHFRTSRWIRLLIGLMLTFAFEHMMSLEARLVWAAVHTVLFIGLVLLVHLADEQWRSRP